MNYTKALFDLLDWQGGTIHQIAEIVGIEPEVLIYGKPESTIQSDSGWIKGQYAFDTCSKEFIIERLLPMYKGNADFWLGFMRAGYLAYIECNHEKH